MFSITKLTEHREIWVRAIDNLNENEIAAIINRKNQINLMIDYLILTFLKTSRVHAMLPKHSNETGSCTSAMIIGSIRLISIGNEYHSNWSIVELILSNASAILWPSSQAINTMVKPRIPFSVAFNSTGIIFPWCNWKQ